MSSEEYGLFFEIGQTRPIVCITKKCVPMRFVLEWNDSRVFGFQGISPISPYFSFLRRLLVFPNSLFQNISIVYTHILSHDSYVCHTIDCFPASLSSPFQSFRCRNVTTKCASSHPDNTPRIQFLLCPLAFPHYQQPIVPPFLVYKTLPSFIIVFSPSVRVACF